LATPTLARLRWLEGKPEKLELLVGTEKDEIFEKVAELFGASAERPAKPGCHRKCVRRAHC
jgi:hypothetical protein